MSSMTLWLFLWFSNLAAGFVGAATPIEVVKISIFQGFAILAYRILVERPHARKR